VPFLLVRFLWANKENERPAAAFRLLGFASSTATYEPNILMMVFTEQTAMDI
jgi:hypothetical protein